jgi:hypothetical protein
MQITVKLDKKVQAALDYIAARYEGEEGEERSHEDAALICILGYYGRKRALDKHAGKVRKVRRALAEGVALPDVEFKRYTPGFVQAKLDAKGTAAEVREWTRKAPTHADGAAPVRKPRKPKAKPAAPAKQDNPDTKF